MRVMGVPPSFAAVPQPHALCGRGLAPVAAAVASLTCIMLSCPPPSRLRVASDAALRRALRPIVRGGRARATADAAALSPARPACSASLRARARRRAAGKERPRYRAPATCVASAARQNRCSAAVCRTPVKCNGRKIYDGSHRPLSQLSAKVTLPTPHPRKKGKFFFVKICHISGSAARPLRIRAASTPPAIRRADLEKYPIFAHVNLCNH